MHSAHHSTPEFSQELCQKSFHSPVWVKVFCFRPNIHRYLRLSLTPSCIGEDFMQMRRLQSQLISKTEAKCAKQIFSSWSQRDDECDKKKAKYRKWSQCVSADSPYQSLPQWGTDLLLEKREFLSLLPQWHEKNTQISAWHTLNGDVILPLCWVPPQQQKGEKMWKQCRNRVTFLFKWLFDFPMVPQLSSV